MFRPHLSIHLKLGSHAEMTQPTMRFAIPLLGTEKPGKPQAAGEQQQQIRIRAIRSRTWILLEHP